MAAEKKPRLTKEDLDARFTALQEKNRERRANKVTGEDIKQRLTERKAEKVRKAEKPVPGRRARILSLSLGIAMLAGSGVLAVTTSAGTDAFHSATRSNDQRIASLTGDLRKIPAANEQSAAGYGADLEKQITAAITKGEQVANLQQEFATILVKGNTESSQNGAPRVSFLDSVKHREKLAPYFVERAFLVDDIKAYAPGSTLPYEKDRIDPRFPWYVGYEPDGRVADPATSKWELISVVATDTHGVFDATWLDRDTASGDLLAWATASYYVDPGAFGSLMVGHTTLSERGADSTNKEGA